MLMPRTSSVLITAARDLLIFLHVAVTANAASLKMHILALGLEGSGKTAARFGFAPGLTGRLDGRAAKRRLVCAG